MQRTSVRGPEPITAKRITGRGEEDVVIGYRPDLRDPLARAVRAFRQAGPYRAGYTQAIVARADRNFPPGRWHASEKRARRALDRLMAAVRGIK